MSVYLCGPIHKCTDDEAISWRIYCTSVLKLPVKNPMVRDYRSKENQLFADIVEGDKADIDSCSIVLVNYTKPSVGTSMEVLYAYERNKTVVLVTNGLDISPWLVYHSDAILRSIPEAVVFINNLGHNLQV